MKKLLDLFAFLVVPAIIASCAVPQQDLQPLNQQDVTPVQTKVDDIDSIVSAQSLTGQPQQTIINDVFTGVITEKLPDDNDGLKHELFMLKLTSSKYSGKVIKIAHDITYAPYVPVVVGDPIEIKGDFLPDATPVMVLHWTHKSDNPKHASGYIKYKGKTYE